MSEITPAVLASLAVGDLIDTDLPLLPGFSPDGVTLELHEITDTGYRFGLTYLGVSLGEIEARTHGGVLTWHDDPKP